MDKPYYWVVSFALVLAVGVMILGAYTRLSDAGLGCPDWPGCYGKLILPNNKAELAQAQQHFPQQPLVIAKAWKEMAHRYIAGVLGLFIFALGVWSIARRRKNPSQALLVPCLLIAAVLFQMMLGMWTVTMKVIPIVVVGHLLGGMTIVALLCWLQCSAKPKCPQTRIYSGFTPWVVLGLMILLLQIFLGAWTSTHYAALACPNFPFCTNSLFPTLDWRNAFNFMAPIGPNYEGGHLAMQARMTIQMVHRYGAFMTVAFWLPFALYLAANRIDTRLRPWGWLILSLLTLQCVLGVLNIVKRLPMLIALSHSAVATLLLMAVVVLLHKLTRPRVELDRER